jgi:hypothetical protein
LYARNHGTLIVPAPPTDTFHTSVEELLARLAALGLQREAVMQEPILESMSFENRLWWIVPALEGLRKEYDGQVFRVHYTNSGQVETADAILASLTSSATAPDNVIELMLWTGDELQVRFDELYKIEVLAARSY